MILFRRRNRRPRNSGYRGIHRPGRRPRADRADTACIADGWRPAIVAPAPEPTPRPLRWPFIPPELRADVARRVRTLHEPTALMPTISACADTTDHLEPTG